LTAELIGVPRNSIDVDIQRVMPYFPVGLHQTGAQNNILLFLKHVSRKKAHILN